MKYFSVNNSFIILKGALKQKSRLRKSFIAHGAYMTEFRPYSEKYYK